MSETQYYKSIILTPEMSAQLEIAADVRIDALVERLRIERNPAQQEVIRTDLETTRNALRTLEDAPLVGGMKP